MRVVLPVEQVREVEAAAMAALPAGTLMQRAAAGLANAAAALLGGCYGRRVVVVAGSGDNGGDALFAGSRLVRRGASVVAVASASRLHEAGLAALVQAGGSRVASVAVAALESADLVIDGIVGIGARPGLSGSAADVAGELTRVRGTHGAGPRVLSVDLPSGIDPDTGETPGAHVRADLTVTFGVHKPGLLIDPGAAAAGMVELVDIGLPLPAEQPADDPAFAAVGLDDVRSWLQVPPRSADKYSRGVVGLVTGSPRYPGAGMLSVHGARCGLAGMVRFVGEEALGQAVASRFPDVVPHSPDALGRVQAWVVGSGGGELGPIVPFERLLADGVPVLVDADGLAHLPAPEDRPEGARLLLTPHAGELARLLDIERDEVQARRLWHARQAAQRLDATVLLKGATTVVAAPDGRVRVPVSPGPSWLATAGSGDVLSGLAGALLATGLAPLAAGVAATVLHSAAARLAGPAMTSADLAAALPRAVRQVLAG
jgi:hydroxyethylthiazole kinase-like uncharacterized protein yjeF